MQNVFFSMKSLSQSHKTFCVLALSMLVACSGTDDDTDVEDMSSMTVDMDSTQGGDMVVADMTVDEDLSVVDMGSDMVTDEDLGTLTDMGEDVDQSEDMGGEQEVIELEGSWASVYGLELIAGDVWGDVSIVVVDNAANVAVTQNADDAEYFPGLYNRVEWTELADDGSFYYCITDFGKDSVEDAQMEPTVADASMPDVGGCGGFPWTQLVPNEEIEIAGMYTSSFDAMESVSSESWDYGYAVASVSLFNNAANVAVTQNADDAEYYPGKFSRVEWTEPTEDGSFYYCITDFGKDSVEDAQMEPTVADASMPDVSGCGGFPWTRLMVTQ